MLQFKYVNQDCLGVTVVLCNTVSDSASLWSRCYLVRHYVLMSNYTNPEQPWVYTTFVFCRGICWIYPGFGKWKFDFVLLTLGAYIIVDTHIFWKTRNRRLCLYLQRWPNCIITLFNLFVEYIRDLENGNFTLFYWHLARTSLLTRTFFEKLGIVVCVCTFNAGPIVLYRSSICLHFMCAL